jgi:hypothetical protein
LPGLHLHGNNCGNIDGNNLKFFETINKYLRAFGNVAIISVSAHAIISVGMT